MSIRSDLQIYEALPVPVAVVRGDAIVLANQCLGAYFGVPCDTLIGTSVRALLQRVAVAAEADMRADEPSWVRVRDAAGEERRVCWRVAPLPGRDDEQVYVLLDAGSQASGPRFLEPLAGTAAELAHEVRNPLGAILNAVALLKRATGRIPAAELLGIIEEEAERIDALVAELLDPAQTQERNVRADRSSPAAVRTSSGSARSR